jgi:hypothetical protein
MSSVEFRVKVEPALDPLTLFSNITLLPNEFRRFTLSAEFALRDTPLENKLPNATEIASLPLPLPCAVKVMFAAINVVKSIRASACVIEPLPELLDEEVRLIVPSVPATVTVAPEAKEIEPFPPPSTVVFNVNTLSLPAPLAPVRLTDPEAEFSRTVPLVEFALSDNVAGKGAKSLMLLEASASPAILLLAINVMVGLFIAVLAGVFVNIFPFELSVKVEVAPDLDGSTLLSNTTSSATESWMFTLSKLEIALRSTPLPPPLIPS